MSVSLKHPDMPVAAREMLPEGDNSMIFDVLPVFRSFSPPKDIRARIGLRFPLEYCGGQCSECSLSTAGIIPGIIGWNQKQRRYQGLLISLYWCFNNGIFWIYFALCQGEIVQQNVMVGRFFDGNCDKT